MGTSDVRDQLQATLGATYSVEREIGRGGMATVFLAQDIKHHRPVALKVLRPDLGAATGLSRESAKANKRGAWIPHQRYWDRPRDAVTVYEATPPVK